MVYDFGLLIYCFQFYLYYIYGCCYIFLFIFRLKNNDPEIINILLKENLNRISVIRQGRIEFIFVFESENSFETEFKPSENIDNYEFYRMSYMTNIKYEDIFHNI